MVENRESNREDVRASRREDNRASRREDDRASRRTGGRTASEAAPNRRDGMTEQCSQCGDAVPSNEWHPVATERDDDGRVEIHDFCSEDCRSAWQTSSSD